MSSGSLAATSSARSRGRRQTGLDAGPVAVCVGRLCRQKGQDVPLAAWSRVTAELPRARLVLVGDGPDRDCLRSSAPPGVVFAGHVTDPVPWYAAADVVVLPSRWEAMPLVLLEAMASGRSVVATDVGGVREALPSDAGIVEIGDAGALAAELLARLRSTDLADAEGVANRNRVRAVHDLGRVGGLVRDLYPHVIAGSARTRNAARLRRAAVGSGR